MENYIFIKDFSTKVGGIFGDTVYFKVGDKVSGNVVNGTLETLLINNNNIYIPIKGYLVPEGQVMADINAKIAAPVSLFDKYFTKKNVIIGLVVLAGVIVIWKGKAITKAIF